MSSVPSPRVFHCVTTPVVRAPHRFRRAASSGNSGATSWASVALVELAGVFDSINQEPIGCLCSELLRALVRVCRIGSLREVRELMNVKFWQPGFTWCGHSSWMRQALARVFFHWMIVVAGAFTTSCFFYDSRWGQAEAEQRNAAQAATPVDLNREQGPRLERRARSLSIRLYATPQHAAQVFDWPHQFSRYLDIVNDVLARDHGVKLEVVDARPWPSTPTHEDLSVLLAELRQTDPGDSVSWVVGLAGQVPRIEGDFRKLGNAYVLGKHLMMRTPSDPAERQAIEDSLNELDENERERLYRKRRTHRAASVLLHELGHTLGCVHLQDEGAFMNPFYNEKMRGFSEANDALVQLSLSVRSDDSAGVDPGLAHRLREHLLGTGEAPWVKEAYHSALEELEALAQQPAPTSRAVAASGTATSSGSAAPPSAGAPQRTAVSASSSINPYSIPPPPPPPLVGTVAAPAQASASPTPPAELSAEQQALFARVQQTHQAGKPREAWQLGQALFEEHLTVYAVQELRCEVAMQMGLQYTAVSKHCQPMMDLARAGAR